MPISTLRSSPAFTALYSWLQGTRVRISGRDHRVSRANSILRGTRIEILGTGCQLTIAPGARLWNCSITLAGENAQLLIGAGSELRGARLSVEDRGSRLTIGANTSITGATLVAQEGRRLVVGEHCMIAQHAELRNSDSHAIYDELGVRVNPARDIVVGRHVWIGVGACLFKGAHVGDGSVIGAQAFVTGEIPPDCVAYGVPATVRRSPIRWERERISAS